MCVCVCLCGSGEVSQYQVCKEPLVRALKLCVCVCATVGSFPSYQVCKELLVRALKACVCVCVRARTAMGRFPSIRCARNHWSEPSRSQIRGSEDLDG